MRSSPRKREAPPIVYHASGLIDNAACVFRKVRRRNDRLSGRNRLEQFPFATARNVTTTDLLGSRIVTSVLNDTSLLSVHTYSQVKNAFFHVSDYSR